MPPEHHAYIWDCVTRVPYRGQGMYPLMLACLTNQLATRDVERAWIAADWANWRSVGGIIHAGFRPVGAVVTYRWGRFAVRKLVANPDAPTDDQTAWRTAIRW